MSEPNSIQLSNDELDILDELVGRGFAGLSLSDIQIPPQGSKLNRAGWLVSLKRKMLEARDRGLREWSYPISRYTKPFKFQVGEQVAVIGQRLNGAFGLKGLVLGQEVVWPYRYRVLISGDEYYFEADSLVTAPG